MPELPTVKISHSELLGDYIVINQNDFDPELHTLFGHTQLSQKLTAGDTKTAPSGAPAPPADETDPKVVRANQLEILLENEGWQAIADIAEPLGIEKPSRGWKLAIPLVEQEFAEA